MRIAEIATAAILGLFSIYLMWKSGEPAGWNPNAERFDNIAFIDGEGPGSGFWPFWLAAIMLVCCACTAWNWHRRRTPASQSGEPFIDGYAQRMMLTVGGGLVGLLAMVHLAGFYGAILLFMFYYLRFLGRHSLLQSLAIAVATPVVGFFFFDVAMRIILPKGYLEPLFIPLYAFFF